MASKKDVISVMTFSKTLLVFQMITFHAESYSFKCPMQSNWKFRAIAKCNNTIQYFCLYSNVKGKYVDGCHGPDWDRRGSKRIFDGSFTRGNCEQERFQPFKFWTNASMSDCIYSKSICSEVGQIVNTDDSSKADRTCRCDYKKSYSFIKTPRNRCFCIPTKEDCSCYVNSCPVNSTLSADYECAYNSITEKPKCIDINKYNETPAEQKRILTNSWKSFKVKRRNSNTVIIFISFCLMIISVTSGVVLALTQWSSAKLEIFKKYIIRRHNNFIDVSFVQREEVAMDTCNEKFHESCESILQVVNAQVHQESGPCKRDIVFIPLRPTTDEVNLLRILHLLFRVASPIVRMIFDYEIQPNQLRKTLDKNKTLLCKWKGKIIGDFQWNLLFKHVKGKTVTSDDFDIELMMNLLLTIAKINISKLYPVKSDRRDCAMLSRIKYIRNETTQLFEGRLSIDEFSKYWDDIGQAVLTLMSSHNMHTLDMENDQEKVRLLGRLLALNPIHIDTKQLCLFIDMSETYPDIILQKMISEYLTLDEVSIQDVLLKEKDQLFHKRIKTISCCKCNIEFSTFIKVIPDNLWQALYEVEERSDLHLPTCSLDTCCECWVPKKNITIDLLIAKTLVLNIPSILLYMTTRLCASGFDIFLLRNQHILYHSMKKARCCKCNHVPSGKVLISYKEWNKLFMKGKARACPTNSEYCCCHYTIKKEIKLSDVDDILLSKIFHVACPVLNQIEKDAFLSFLNWSVDYKPLQRALTELLNVINDITFRHRISSSFHSQSSDKAFAKYIDARSWVSRHLQHQKTTAEQHLKILIRDTDGLNVKCIQIPADFPLPPRNKELTDLTSEENNFLVVFYVLTKIVYPVIKQEFDTKCPDLMIDKIRMEIYDQQNCIDENRKMNRIHLTQNQKQQLFARNDENPKRFDLKLMIYILKRITENEKNRDYVDQLDVIGDIQREIEHSSCGVLTDARFREIFQSIYKNKVGCNKENIKTCYQAPIGNKLSFHYSKSIPFCIHCIKKCSQRVARFIID